MRQAVAQHKLPRRAVPVHWESRIRLKKSEANVQKMRPRRVMSAVVESRLRLEKSRLHSMIFHLFRVSNG